MTQVLIKFYIQKKDENSIKVLYWSCVLETVLQNLDYKTLNSANHFPLSNSQFSDYELFIELSEFTSSSIDSDYNDYIKRPTFFLAKDWKKINRPYNSCCCNVTNYYNPKQDALTNLKNLIGAEKSEIFYFQLINEINISIEKSIGINIFESGACPNSLSIYQRLQSFYINCNKERNILIESKDENEYSVIIEAYSKDNILFKKNLFFSTHLEYKLPNQNELENCYNLHITIFSKIDSNDYEIVYEEILHPVIRTIHCNIANKYGTRIINNRFINKQEEVDIAQSSNIVESDKSTPWIDYENLYKKFYKTEFQLDAQFFDIEEDVKEKGRKDYLNWITNNLKDAQTIYIIDPFFDEQGIDDLIACGYNNSNLKVTTLNPDISKREGEILTSGNLSYKFYTLFPRGELYYCDKKELHDRFLIIEKSDVTKYFSISNSWNGTVRYNSLFVQELNYEHSLKVKKIYGKCFDNGRLVKNETTTKESPIEAKEQEPTEEDVQQTLENIKKENYFIADDLANLFKYNAYGKIEEEKCIGLTEEYFEKLSEDDRTSVINYVTKNALKLQKEKITDPSYINSEIYNPNDSAKKIRKTVRNFRFNFLRSFYYKFDYGYYGVLKQFFYLAPEKVINSIIKNEQKISLFKIKKNNDEIFVNKISLPLITLFLQRKFSRVKKEDTESAINFANETKSLYCKFYILYSLLESDNNIFSIDEIDVLCENLSFSNEVINEVYILAYDFLNFRSQNFDFTKEDLFEHIVRRFAKDEYLIIDFAIDCFIIHNNNLDDLNLYLNKAICVASRIEDLILYLSLNSCESHKLSCYIKPKINKSDLELLEKYNLKNERFVDLFYNSLNTLGNTLYRLAEKNEIFKLCNKFEFNSLCIFDTMHDYSKTEDNYYLLNIIFECIKIYKQEGNDCSFLNEFKYFWMIPFVFNTKTFNSYKLHERLISLLKEVCPSEIYAQIKSLVVFDGLKKIF